MAARALLARPELLTETSGIFFLIDSKLIVGGLNGASRLPSLQLLLEYVEGQLALLRTFVEVQVIWIPGHVDTPGNERADALAKCGARTDPFDGRGWRAVLMELQGQ